MSKAVEDYKTDRFQEYMKLRGWLATALSAPIENTHLNAERQRRRVRVQVLEMLLPDFVTLYNKLQRKGLVP